MMMRTTPCGQRPRECVREAPHGASVRFGFGFESDFVIEHRNGTREYFDVPEHCHRWTAAMSARQRDTRGEAVHNSVSAIPDGWIQSAGVYRMQPSPRIAAFTGTFGPVPQPPASPQKPETLYWFIGLEDRTQGKNTAIHQPVLTWGDETEGGLGGWSLWSWTCCPKNITWHSPPVAVPVGVTIHGAIEQSATDPAIWRIDSAFRNASSGDWINTTLHSQVGEYEFNYADVTLEVYNVTSCSEMTAGPGVEFADLELTLSDRSLWKVPEWYINGLPNDCRTKIDVTDNTNMTIVVGGN